MQKIIMRSYLYFKDWKVEIWRSLYFSHKIEIIHIKLSITLLLYSLTWNEKETNKNKNKQRCVPCAYLPSNVEPEHPLLFLLEFLGMGLVENQLKKNQSKTFKTDALYLFMGSSRGVTGGVGGKVPSDTSQGNFWGEGEKKKKEERARGGKKMKKKKGK